jgi:tRNA (guanine-N7-)-methyltransferase
MEIKEIVLKENELEIKPNWGNIFERNAPLFLEIGIGNGEFIVWIAKKNPQSNFIGVEVSKKYLKKAANRVAKEGLKNVKLMHIEASKFISKFLERETLSGIYINFPDPWLKKKHKKRRLISKPFVWLIADRLILDGFFLMVTDCEDYAYEVVELFSYCQAFSPLWDTPIKNELPDYYLTKYGRKWLFSGLPIFYIGFKKKSRVDIPEWVYNFYPLARLSKEEKLLENILEINEKIDFFELAKNLSRGIIWKKENEVIKVLDIYSKEDGILIDTLVTKGILRQRFFVAVKPYHQKGLIISIHDSEKPDITDEIHRAITLITLEIQKFFKDSRILKSTCKKKILEELQNI